MSTELEGQPDSVIDPLAGFSPRESADFAGYLKRVIENTSAGAPEVWTLSETIEQPPA